MKRKSATFRVILYFESPHAGVRGVIRSPALGESNLYLVYGSGSIRGKLWH